jgi:tRNA nucleotidyltransferase (CCA-adding enzyme)
MPAVALTVVTRQPEVGAEMGRLAARIAAAGGRALMVGGGVRDALLGRELVDVDLEVYGLQPAPLRRLLEESYRVELVGEAFGVLKLAGWPIDVALPRRESKRGLGHRGFEVYSDPDMTFADAALRRDFTINAMGFDPLGGELLDPWGGRVDLGARILRHTSERFAEDPLRVLRGAQLAARFELAPAPETTALCRVMSLEGLPVERVAEEWRKLLLLGVRPSIGLRFLLDCGWIERDYPELFALVDCPQDPEWHPEGDVWIHTLHVLDAFARERTGEPEEDLVVGLACLCHDLGKPATTFREGERWRSPGHEQAGSEPTRSLLRRISTRTGLPEEVVPLVEHHLKPRQLFDAAASDTAVRRLARKVGRIDRLVRVARADAGGRPPRADEFLAGTWLLERARVLEVATSAPVPLVLGRHLIERGLEPGAHFKPLLERLYEAQLDGAFSDLEAGLVLLDRVLAEDGASPGARVQRNRDRE